MTEIVGYIIDDDVSKHNMCMTYLYENQNQV